MPVRARRRWRRWRLPGTPACAISTPRRFYGFGLSERRIGDFLRDKPRDSYVLSTKVGRLLRPVPEDQVPDHSYVDPLPFALDYDYSYDGIMRSVEFSYARLGLNRIDILFVHDIGVYTHGVEKTQAASFAS